MSSLSGNLDGNFNLSNAFVILLKERVVSFDEALLILIKRAIILGGSHIINFFVFIILSIVSLEPNAGRWAFLISLLYTLIIAVIGKDFLTCVEKKMLHDIVYDDYFKTHKVNNEQIIQYVALADNHCGAISIINKLMVGAIMLNIIVPIIQIIEFIITR